MVTTTVPAASTGTPGQVLTTDGTTWAPAAGGGGGTSNYLGQWNPATTYAIGDEVLRRGKMWTAVAASTGVAPELVGTFTSVGVKQTNASTANGTGGTSVGDAMAVRFAPTSNVTVNAVQINMAVGGTLKVGIASSLGANTGAVVWLSKNDAAAVVSGLNTIILPDTIDLVAGTNYYVVCVTEDGTDVYKLMTSGGSAGAYVGLTNGAKFDGTAAAWGASGTTYVLAFDIGSTDSPFVAGITVTLDTSVNQSGTAAPTTGTWAVGDKVWNTAAAASGTVGWVCTTAGTPGTWKTFGTIAA